MRNIYYCLMGNQFWIKKIVIYSLSLVRSWERELSSFIFALNALLFFVVGVFVAQYF